MVPPEEGMDSHHNQAMDSQGTPNNQGIHNKEDLVRYILNIVYDLNLSDKNPPVFFLYS
jgi:hypothetical protein